jgi:hypothetical protein
MLFAGALHVNLGALAKEKKSTEQNLLFPLIKRIEKILYT